MGYRPNIVKRYEVEYGSEIGGFNYDPQGLDNFLVVLIWIFLGSIVKIMTLFTLKLIVLGHYKTKI